MEKIGTGAALNNRKNGVIKNSGNNCTKYVKKIVSFKYLSNSWKTLEMSLSKYEINIILIGYANCLIIGIPTTFTITDTKLFVPLVILSTQDNEKLLQQFKSGFEETLNWNNYQSNVTVQEQNRYLDYLNDPRFQGVNSLFVSSFKNNNGWASCLRFYLPQVEIKDYNVLIDWGIFFDQPVKNHLRTHDNIRKIATGPGDDYTTGCLLDYPYFKNY